MYVIVTGAAGFIGRHVVRRLVASGRDVLGVDRRQWTPVVGERQIVADLAEPCAHVDEVLGRADGVIHLAARPGVRDRGRGIDEARTRDNVVAGRRVLAGTPAHVPMVVASSSSVYGGAGDPAAPRPCREDDELHPRGGYAVSKVELEYLCARRAARGGRVHVARPFTVAGPGQRPDMALALWIAALRDGQPVRVLGDPGRRRDVTDVGDVARGLVGLLGVPGSEVVNLGSGVTHRLDTLLAMVSEAVGVPALPRVAAAVPEDVPATRADVARCRRLLGFVPASDVAGVVARQVAATAISAAANVDGGTPGVRAGRGHRSHVATVVAGATSRHAHAMRP